MPEPADQTRQQAVFDRLRQGILAGTLAPGARLPPSRHLAEELGVARQTVVLAYERLAAEGYVRARVGSGTYVATDLPDAAPSPAAPAAAAASPLSQRGAALAAIPASAADPHDPGALADEAVLLGPGVPAPELFPAAAWARATTRVLRRRPAGRTGYPDPQGLPALRAAIAAHLAATRGLLTDPAHIVVTAGTQQALRLAAELLLDPGDAAWVEDPGYIAGRGALLRRRRRAGPGAERRRGPGRGRGHRALRPRHGSRWWRPRTPRRWAARCRSAGGWRCWTGPPAPDAWVLEDDADSEFRWQGKPLPPLASLDRTGRVIYCGTFSKSLAPALRLGFAVVPPPLTAAFVRARTLMDRGTGVLTQAVLAEFMQAGALAPHIRRMRTEYARTAAGAARRAGTALPRRRAGCRPRRAAPGPAPGRRGADEAAVVRAARARGLAVAPLAAYYAGPRLLAGLVAGFAATPAARATEAARLLAAAIATAI